MKRFFSAFLAVVMAASMCTACSSTETTSTSSTKATTSTGSTSSTTAPASSDPIKISLVGPVTGPYTEYGLGFKAAAEIMVDKWNNNGGINGRKIQLQNYDEQGSIEEGVAIAQKIAGDDSNYGVVGHFISIMEAAKIYQENNISMIAPAASTTGFSEIGNCIFRNNATIKAEANGMLDCCAKANKKKLGVVHLAGDWGKASFDALKELIANERKSDGFQIVADNEITDSTVDVSGTLSKFKAAGADVAFMFCFYNTVAPFVTQAKKTLPSITTVCGVNCYNDEFLKLGKTDVEGCLSPSVFSADSAETDVQYFVDQYKKKMNGETPSGLSAQCYDSVGILLTAIKNEGGKLDKDAIRDQINKIIYKGVGGQITFTNRDAKKNFTPAVVKNGKWATLQ